MITAVHCDTCGNDYEVSEIPNMIVFCPVCRKEIYLSCEAGYGPTVPCYLHVGEMPAGTVTLEDKTYVLNSLYMSKVIPLKHRGLKALQEAAELMEEYLKKSVSAE